MKTGYLQQERNQKHKSRDSKPNNRKHVKILTTFKPQEPMPAEATPLLDISVLQETTLYRALVVLVSSTQ